MKNTAMSASWVGVEQKKTCPRLATVRPCDYGRQHSMKTPKESRGLASLARPRHLGSQRFNQRHAGFADAGFAGASSGVGPTIVLSGGYVRSQVGEQVGSGASRKQSGSRKRCFGGRCLVDGRSKLPWILVGGGGGGEMVGSGWRALAGSRWLLAAATGCWPLATGQAARNVDRE